MRRTWALLACVLLLHPALVAAAPPASLPTSARRDAPREVPATLADLRAALPSVRWVQAHADAYERVRREALGQGWRVIPLPLVRADAAARPVYAQAPAGERPADCREDDERPECPKHPANGEAPERAASEQPAEPPAEQAPEQPPVATQGEARVVVPDLHVSGGSDDATVVFMIIGVVVVAFLVVAAVQATYNAATRGEAVPGWLGIEALGGRVVEREEEQTGAYRVRDRFRQSALRLHGGVQPQGQYGVGAALEVGRLDGYLALADGKDFDLSLRYAAVGPTIVYFFSPRLPNDPGQQAFWSLDLLYGATDDEAVDAVAAARAGLSFVPGGGLTVGLHFGAIYVALDENQGLVRERSDFNTVLGVQVGYLW